MEYNKILKFYIYMVVSGCWDTGAEYNMLDEETALLIILFNLLVA